MSDITEEQRFNQELIAEYRAKGGKVDGRFAHSPLLLLTTTGAKSGLPRTMPLVYSTDGDRLIVIASKGGAPNHPDWYHNLVANAMVIVELGAERFPARALLATGEERQRLYDQQAALMPFFATYQENTARQIPVVILERLG
ncbi:MAG: nitroreductase family deazaflavin-dependent oxidoreductase [Chloroflexota bacterium]